MIGMDGAAYSVGMREWTTERGIGLRSVSPCRGELLTRLGGARNVQTTGI